jgi:hypothetical protein
MEGESTTSCFPVQQFSIMLENRVGALASLVRLLNDNFVEVLGLSVQDSADVTVVRMVVSDSETAETLLIEKGISFGMCDLVVVELKDGPSELGKCLQELLAAETNIYFCYPLMIQAGNCCALALRLDDTEFGITALQNCGFKVLFQNDLAR